MDVDTGKTCAVKYQPRSSLKPITYIQLEKDILEGQGKLIDTIETAKGVYLAQKLAWGENVYDFMERNRSKDHSDIHLELQRVEIAIQFLERLYELHKKGCLHGDMRLANAMWDSEKSHLELIDFELAKQIEDEGKVKAQDPREDDIHIPPEILKARVEKNPPIYHTKQTDIYSAGIALLELFSDNKTNQTGNMFTLYQNLYSWKAGPPPFDPEDGLDFISYEPTEDEKPLHDVLTQMVDVSPEKRPDLPTAIQVFKALRADIERQLPAVSTVSSNIAPVDSQLLCVSLSDIPLNDAVQTTANAELDDGFIKKLNDFHDKMLAIKDDIQSDDFNTLKTQLDVILQNPNDVENITLVANTLVRLRDKNYASSSSSGNFENLVAQLQNLFNDKLQGTPKISQDQKISTPRTGHGM